MFTSPLKSSVISAIALAMTLVLAAPASATTFTLSSDKASLTTNEVATFTTDAIGDDNVAALFVNGVYYTGGPGLSSGSILPWTVVYPCVTVDVTLRLYYLAPGSPTPVVAPTLATPYDAEVLIEFVGDTSVPCNYTWGDGLDGGGGSGGSGGSDNSDEPLAKTGSDASAVAGLTGVAGVAALAVAVAVALRTRRAQR
jgi:hypothetical protein